MIEVPGKYCTARVYTDNVEEAVLRPDCVKTGKELLRLPVVKPHSVLEPVVA